MEIYIKNFRGVREGEIKLSKLNILVGSNNSGKTSVLEALFLLPNPLRRVPYAIIPLGGREVKVLSAIEVLAYLHETLGSKAFISLFHNYNSSSITIKGVKEAIDTRLCIQRIDNIAEIYVDTIGPSLRGAYRIGKIDIIGNKIVHGRLSRATFDEEQRLYSATAGSIDVVSQYFVADIGDALYVHPSLIKLLWNYLSLNWVRLRSMGIPSIVAKSVSESVSGNYDDLLLEPFIGGEQTIYVRTVDGRGIRLGDLGDGVKFYTTMMLVYKLSKPRILLIDDIESHINPYLLVHVARWLGNVLGNNTIVIVTTHSIEAVKIISDTLIDYEPRTILLSLRDGVLKAKYFKLGEIDNLERLGLDIRAMESVLI